MLEADPVGDLEEELAVLGPRVGENVCHLHKFRGRNDPESFACDEGLDEFGNDGLGAKVDRVANTDQLDEVGELDLFGCDFGVDFFFKKLKPKRPQAHVLRPQRPQQFVDRNHRLLLRVELGQEGGGQRPPRLVRSAHSEGGQLRGGMQPRGESDSREHSYEDVGGRECGELPNC